MCLDTDKVDSSHYFTTPGLAFDSLLKYTNVKFNYVKDPDMLLLIEKGIRGGIGGNKRYAKANNKECVDFDRKKDISYIKYLDANNLYGWAMSQYLLMGNFK